MLTIISPHHVCLEIEYSECTMELTLTQFHYCLGFRGYLTVQKAVHDQCM